MCTLNYDNSASHAQRVHGMFRANLKGQPELTKLADMNHCIMPHGRATLAPGTLFGPASVEYIEPGEGTLVE